MPSPKGSFVEVVAVRRAAAAVTVLGAALVFCLILLVGRQYVSTSSLLRSGWSFSGTRTPEPSVSSTGGRGAGDSGSSRTADDQSRMPPPLPPLPPPPPPPLPRHCSFRGQLPLESVRWSRANGTANRLSVRGCQLRRIGHAEAQRCLAGKRLVFVGDSVTRYMYLTLLHFLEKGRWPAPLGGVPGEPSVANEHEWPSWNDFLRGTNALFGGHELCDCFRADYDPKSGKRPPEDEKHENRYYQRQLGQGAGDIFVSHFTYTTFPNKLHGHRGFPPYPEGRQPCAPATCDFPADWAYHLAEALAGPIKDMRPTHLIVNSGLWGTSNELPGWPDIAAAGRAAVAAQGGRAIWRTTTANKGPALLVKPDHDDQAIAHTQAEGWDLLDAMNITRPLLAMKKLPLWDGRHFLAVVYRELNLYLLNMICPEDGGGGS